MNQMLYVSPQGNDNNPGTLDKPFKTPMRARAAVRLLKVNNKGKMPEGGMTVWLRGGRYELAETFVLGPEDSGQQGRPVVYRSYADERPVLSGGRLIRNWRKAEDKLPGLPEAAKGKVWVAEAKEGKRPFRQLWANGKRLIRARWPKNGEAQFRLVDNSLPSADALNDQKSRERWEHDVLKQSWRTVEAPVEARKAFLTGGLPEDLGNGSAEFVTVNCCKWMTIRVPVASVQGMQMTMAAPLGYLSYYWNNMCMMSGGCGYIENALSLLDQADEWYLDRKTGRVYYLPEDGVDPNTEEIVAPVLEQLICLRGTLQAPVEFVELHGLWLEHGEWSLPEFGYRPMLGCYYGTQSTPLFFMPPFFPMVGAKGVPAGSIRPRDEHPEYCLPAAVELIYARECLLELCRVEHVGASGIGLGEGCRNNRVVGCEVSDAGGHGIHIGLAHGPVCGEDFAWKDTEDEPQHNEILNCYVHHTGQMDWGAYGIMSAYCRGTRIAYNLVEHLPYGGICACFTMFAFPSGREEDVTVECNHVHDIMKKLYDGGGIYTKDGVAKTSVIRGNFIHDVGGSTWGIYLDDGTYGFHLEDNILYNATLRINDVRGVTPECFTWGKNYIGDDNYPRELAEKAGPEEPYRRLLLGGGYKLMDPIVLENKGYRVEVDRRNGAITRLLDRIGKLELIAEPRLAGNFQILVPLPGYEANYIDGRAQTLSAFEPTPSGVMLRWNGPLASPKGTFQVDVEMTVSLTDEAVEFRLKIHNGTSSSIAEVMFPCIGGMQGIGRREDTRNVFSTTWSKVPDLFTSFPESMGIGCGGGIPYGEFVVQYPGGMEMPWVSFYNEKLNRALYFGCHDPVVRTAMMRFELHPNVVHNRDGGNWPLPGELAKDEPQGLVASWVNFPYTKPGETFEGGTVVLACHEGDWHDSTRIYRRWFLSRFPIVKAADNWIRREQAFQDVLYLLGEGNQFGTFRDVPRIAHDGLKYGVRSILISGWDLHGHDGCYPFYEPDPRVGTWADLKAAVCECHAIGAKVFIFANIQQAHVYTDWYRDELQRFRQMKLYGNSNVFSWGMGTVNARFNGNGRPMVDLSPSFPEYRRIIVEKMERLARTGVDGIHLDKVCSGLPLDYNPELPVSPDRSNSEGLLLCVREIEKACKAINPDFALSTECCAWDRMLSHSPVTWNWAWQNEHLPVSKFTFPEWLSAISVVTQYDYVTVNNAIRYGFQLLVGSARYTQSMDYEPYRLFSRYIAEVLRIRETLREILFEGEFRDTLGAVVQGEGGIRYSVHRHPRTGRRAVVLVNYRPEIQEATVTFESASTSTATLYVPFEGVREVILPGNVKIPVNRLAIVVEAGV